MSATGGPRVVDLPPPWRDDPLLVAEHRRRDLLRVEASPDAVALLMAVPGTAPAVLALGDARTAARLVDGLALVPGECAVATLPRGTWELLDSSSVAALDHLPAAYEWDWLMTTSPPEGEVPDVPVDRLYPDPASTAEVTDLLARAHPTARTSPDDPHLVGWWVVRDGGALVAAAGAVHVVAGDALRIVSVGVDPDARGRRLAGAVVAAAVRDCLPLAGEPPIVAIAHYAENGPASRAYRRLGFTPVHEFESRRDRPGRH